MTTPPELSPDEAARLQALRRLNLVETPLTERFERITRLAKRVMNVDIAAISLIEADRQYFKSIQGLNVCETSRDISFCGHAILGEDAFVVSDAREDPRFRDNPLVTGEPGIVSYAAVPLRAADGSKVGTLCVIHTSLRELSPDDLQSLRDLALMAQGELESAAASAVQAALIEEVSVEQRRALIDPLTRLWNREGILRLAEETVEQTQDSDTGSAVVMVDLDSFKQINDTLGHAAGDAVLRAAARRMLSALRESDVVGRIGGDEFLCVLSPCESAEAAASVAERIRDTLAGNPIATGSDDVTVRASLGVRYVRAGWSGRFDELLESADQAMYRSKGDGRDCVRSADHDREAA